MNSMTIRLKAVEAYIGEQDFHSYGGCAFVEPDGTAKMPNETITYATFEAAKQAFEKRTGLKFWCIGDKFPINQNKSKFVQFFVFDVKEPTNIEKGEI